MSVSGVQSMTGLHFWFIILVIIHYYLANRSGAFIYKFEFDLIIVGADVKHAACVRVYVGVGVCGGLRSCVCV